MGKIEIDLDAITQEMDSLKDQKARLEFELKNTKQRIEILEMQLSALLEQQAVNEMDYGVFKFGFETKTRTALDQSYLKEHYADIAAACTFTKEKQDFYFKINK